jgi:hypothetical protein
MSSPIRKSVPTQEKLLRDGELMEQARRKAGSKAALAAAFGVSQSSTSRWGRERGIPRHMRPRIEAYVGGRPVLEMEPVAPTTANPLLELRRLLHQALGVIDQTLAGWAERPDQTRPQVACQGQNGALPSLPSDVADHAYRHRLTQLALRAAELIADDEERRLFRARVGAWARDVKTRPDLNPFEDDLKAFIDFAAAKYPVVELTRAWT